MIVDIFGILSICTLINEYKIVSIIFFAVGTGLACSICEVRKITSNRRLILVIEAVSVIMYTTSAMGEINTYMVFLFSLGICLMFVSNNINREKRKLSVVLLCCAVICSIVPFISQFDMCRRIIFMVAVSCFEVLIYYENNVTILISSSK